MAYIFDFDGTLVDSMDYWAGRHIQVLKNAGIDCPDNFVETITPLGNLKASEYTISLGLQVSLEEYLSNLNKILFEYYSKEVALKPNVLSALKFLKVNGNKLNVLTASPHFYVDVALKRLGIYDFFDNVWTIEDFDCTKDQEIIYEKTAERLEEKIENCVFVDDNYIAIKTAKSAGMKTVAIYDATAQNLVQSLKNLADKYFYDFKEFIL